MNLAMDPAAAYFTPPAVVQKTALDLPTALLMAYAALLPFEWALSEMVHISPADMVLILTVFVASGRLRYRPEAWSGWHYGLLAIFALSTLSVAVRNGGLDQYVYLNKDAGLLILFLAYTLLTSILTTWGKIRLVLRAFVVSVVLQNLVGLVAWVASTRFGIDSVFVSETDSGWPA